MWMMPLHLHVNQKSDYDDDMIIHVHRSGIGPDKILRVIQIVVLKKKIFYTHQNKHNILTQNETLTLYFFE